MIGGHQPDFRNPARFCQFLSAFVHLYAHVGTLQRCGIVARTLLPTCFVARQLLLLCQQTFVGQNLRPSRQSQRNDQLIVEYGDGAEQLRAQVDEALFLQLVAHNVVVQRHASLGFGAHVVNHLLRQSNVGVVHGQHVATFVQIQIMRYQKIAHILRLCFEIEFC